MDGAAISGADLAADGRLRFVAGDREAALAALDAGGAAIVPEATAERLGLLAGPGPGRRHRGRHIDAPAGRRDRRPDLPGRGGEAMLVGWDDAIGRLGVAGADAFAIRFARDAPASARSDVEAAAAAAALEVVT